VGLSDLSMTSTSPSPQAVLHLITLHHLAQAGFASTSQAASLTLTSALEHYLQLVARTSAEKACLAGRSKPGVRDLARALEDLGVGTVEDVQEFAVGLKEQVEFVGLGTELKNEGLDGRDVEGLNLGELRLVQEQEVPERWWDDEVEEDEGDEMEVDEDEDAEQLKPFDFRHASPDMSWLPPLPGGEQTPQIQQVTTLPAENTEAPSQVAIPASTQTIAERYRRPIPHNTSQHSQSHTFRDPPNTYPPPKLSQSPSSFPSLIKTYEAAATEPSVSSFLNPLRAQALEILRRQSDLVNSSTSLSPPSSLPPPRSTPYVPTHSETLPTHSIPLNPSPHPSSILNPLLHTINSPHLPPTLRERLTHIRPPQPQVRDGEALYYGEPIRGPDTAALAKARGKQGEGEESWVRATWDSGPKGLEKWGKGEDGPRMPENSGQGVGKLKLKLVASPGGMGIAEGISPGANGLTNGGLSPAVVGPGTLSPGSSSNGVATNGPTFNAPTGGGIKLRLGLPRKDSNEAQRARTPPLPSDTTGQANGTKLSGIIQGHSNSDIQGTNGDLGKVPIGKVNKEAERNYDYGSVNGQSGQALESGTSQMNKDMLAEADDGAGSKGGIY
jgi:hypothetical protein